jgi:hypothetical protein
VAVLPEGQGVRLAAPAAPLHCVLVGGEPLGARFIGWNFVASRRERIVRAAQDWAARPNATFPQVAGASDFIALPAKRPA